MTSEKDLIGKLGKLRQIKPSQDWVSLTKIQVLGDETKNYGSQISIVSVFRVLFQAKPVFASLITVFVLLGMFSFVKSSLPGDPLYVIRKAAHDGRAVFISEAEKPAFQLGLANERLEDLAKSPAKNLAPTISEFQANMSEAAKTLSRMDATTSDPTVIKKIVEETRKLEAGKQRVESLGVVVGEEGTAEFETALRKVTENLIEDLGNRTLNKEKEEILNEMKELFEKGNYSEALELYLTSQ